MLSGFRLVVHRYIDFLFMNFINNFNLKVNLFMAF